MYINKAIIYGNLTRDPEKRALPSGQAVCSFAVATNRTYTDKDGKKQEQTEYHDVVAFGKLADVMGQWLKKGRPVYIEGRMQTRSWEQDGVKRYRTEIVADNFQFGADGVCRVLEHKQIMTTGNLHNGGHIAGKTGIMHNKNSACLFCNA